MPTGDPAESPGLWLASTLAMLGLFLLSARDQNFAIMGASGALSLSSARYWALTRRERADEIRLLTRRGGDS